MDSTEKLIDNVKKHRILYDLSHPAYKNKKSKNKIWEEIGTLLDIDGEEAKKRWKNVRDCYAKHLRSGKTHTGQQAKHINRYKHWPWAAQMSAFKPFLRFAQKSRNLDATNEDTRNNLEEYDTIKIEMYESTSGSDVAMSRSSTNIADKSNISPQLSEKRTPKRNIQDKNESSVSQVSSYLKNKGNTYESYDDLDLLFLGHAKTIKKLSAKRQVIAKYRVAQVIMEEELHCLEEPAVPSSLPLTSGTNYNAPSLATSYQKSCTCETSNELSTPPEAEATMV